jgi:signal transduction histidine kinase
MNHTALPETTPILIVDDRPENLLSLEGLLADQGYELVKASSGNEALRLSLKQDFALVLLDVQMPDMDGFETAELMRANPKTKHIPIIFVTAGMKDFHFQFKGYDSGAVDYLAKPIEPLFLQSKVRIFAELYRQRREIELHNNNLEDLVIQRTEELRQSAEDLKASNQQLQLEIAEQKRMEDQIRQTQKMDVIGQLAGGIAHDFNNMLTAIMGSAELMARHIKDNSAAMTLLDNIQKAASRSSELTGQLLAFSRKGQKNVVHVRIDTTIHEVISLLERTIDKKITLETRLIAKNACVTGDPTLLQNALLNLGINARDAMPEGGIITFTTTNVVLDSNYCEASPFDITPGQYIEISVSDNGSGMTKEVIQHIFEPFFTTKEVGKGTGLGLAVVYGTITDHHGCITIYSEPGIGTVFKIYLPVSHEKKVEVATSEELIHGSGGVLLVDDEEIVRAVGEAILEDSGYRVYLAEDGEHALEVYAREKNNISLVILDMLMPRMGGKETLARLMEINPDIPVLISSGFHQEGTIDELEKLGARGFLQKPYHSHVLCKAVADAVGYANR